jgi:hypothetical protein
MACVIAVLVILGSTPLSNLKEASVFNPWNLAPFLTATGLK